MYDRILVVVNGSPVSDHALEETIKLAGLSGGKLHVVTIVDNPLHHFPDCAVYYNPESLHEATLEAADDVLAEAREKVKTSNVEGATFDRVCQGRVNEEIAERIELETQVSDADMVVMSTHSCRGIRRLILGSVAEGLIRVASYPALLVRDK